VTPFETLRGDLDAGVNNHLGDSISIVFRNGDTATRLGFVELSADGAGTDGYNPVRQQWHITIDRAQLPEGPEAVMRLTAAPLPGWYKMGPGVMDDDGNAYSRDLQKAPMP